MKLVNKFLTLLFLGILASGCFDQPQFSDIPEIEMLDIYFGETPDFADADSIVIKIKFKDGDGNLGLDENEINPPFNKRNFFLDSDVNGKLLTIRSRSLPCCTELPPYEKPFYCTNYTESTEELIFESSVLDDSYNIIDTIQQNGVTYFAIKDTVYFEPNEDHYNIKVQYFVKEGGTFKEFNWLTDVPNQSSKCGITFDGRFGRFPDEGNAVEGVIAYSMKSTGFKTLFSIKPMKLKITIKDRALNVSNTIETNEFTILGIKR